MMTAAEEDKEKQQAKDAIGQLFGYLRDLIYNPSSAQLDLTKLPEEFMNLGKGLLYYASCVSEATTLAGDLARGDLNGKLPSRGNEIASPLKSLQASLKHLTWQTKQVAKGDYKQQVSFMGEFAESFNTMTDQLSKQRDALLNEIEISKKKSEALSLNNSLMEMITENISQWIVVVDIESFEWLYVNRDVSTVLHSNQSVGALKEWLRERIGEAPQGPLIQMAEFELPSDDGPTQYFSVAIHPLRWYEHDTAAFVFTDVSSEKRQIHKLETVAYYDPLTKAFNRHYGMELLTKWLSNDIIFIICFVDMDNLKYVNDKFGHAEGDAYILKVMDVLRLFSDDAIICRLGGDEFMLLSRRYGMFEAERRLEELRDLLVSGSLIPGSVYHRSISYGVVYAAAGETNSASELLSRADEKMYKYKREHKMQRGQSAPSGEALPVVAADQ